MTTQSHDPWKVSLHGGHSGDYCEHARGSLRETLDAAVAFGYHTYGVTEHAPRIEDRFLYAEEVALGWTAQRLIDDFEAYAAAIRQPAEDYADRLTVLCGFEIEVVPTDRYVSVMRGYREAHDFDYIVGSVHYVDEYQVDGSPETFGRAVEAFGGIERLAVRYYEVVAEMIEALRPEVVGHLDLIRRNASRGADLASPPIRRAALEALDAARRVDAILDVNTAGYRKGLGSPYVAPWLIKAAVDLGVGLCFGDDSHGPDQVGAGVDDARAYLLANGVREIAYLTRENGCVVRRTAPTA